MNTIITKEAQGFYKTMPDEYKILNPLNINLTLNVLCSLKDKELNIYDKTFNASIDHGKVIPVNDHINCSGNNPLIGNQKELKIDFIDISSLYIKQKGGIITHCCGDFINTQYQYPSHYLCYISILAKTQGIKKIKGYLINILH
tara:strand:+ start:2135 stop:2566 length:432 start_codon:yes stop_codon:yes gene_type:complete